MQVVKQCQFTTAVCTITYVLAEIYNRIWTNGCCNVVMMLPGSGVLRWEKYLIYQFYSGALQMPY